MKIVFLYFLIVYPVIVFAHDAEQSSQNKFSLSSIQSIVRTALLKADTQIEFLTLSHDLDPSQHVAVLFRPSIQDGVRAGTADTSSLIPGKMRSYNLKSYTYMISYAHGNIIRAFLPGAIMPGIFVNQNWASSWAPIK